MLPPPDRPAVDQLTLPRLGWPADEPLPARPDRLARVARRHRTECEVLTAAGALTAGEAAPLAAAGRADPSALPCVGDWVELSGPGVDTGSDRDRVVVRVLPRRRVLGRAGTAPGTSGAQVLAANVDVVRVVEPLVPRPSLGRVDRLLALAWAAGAVPEVVLTKADLAHDPGRMHREVQASTVGAAVHCVSAVTGVGLEVLGRVATPGQTMAFLGPSGAGKSTSRTPSPARTSPGGPGTARRQRPAHPVRRELHVLPSGVLVVDTPGLRAVVLQGTALDALDDVYGDVDALAAGCRFRDCGHDSEPGCAVLAAVSSGEVPGDRPTRWRSLRPEASSGPPLRQPARGRGGGALASGAPGDAALGAVPAVNSAGPALDLI